MTAISVTGADYAAVSRALASAAPDIRAEMRRAIAREAREVIKDMRAAVKGIDSKAQGSTSVARATNALRGGRGFSGMSWDARVSRTERALGRSGLRDSVARGVRSQQKDRGFGVGVRIRASGSALPADQKKLPKALNRGQWRHPVFGNRNAWVVQTATPKGWFDETGKAARPEVIRATADAVERAARKLALRLEAAG